MILDHYLPGDLMDLLENVTEAHFTVDASGKENPELYRDNLKVNFIDLGYEIITLNQDLERGKLFYRFNIRRRENA